MKAILKRYITFIALWPALFQGEQVTIENSPKGDLEHVVLQLPWSHGMRFAGYYLAKEKGFYREAGFDVEIRERRPNVSSTELVISGDADYGVSSSVLVSYIHGMPVMVLAAVAQHIPFVLVAPEHSGIHELRDFRGKKIMMASTLMVYSAQVMLASVGISLEDVEFVPYTEDVNLFLNGYADACLAFVGSMSLELEERGIPYVIFHPADFGADGSGEVLFTSQVRAIKNPGRVKAFRDASLKGWAYFANHTDEAIRLVSNYAPGTSPERLASDARIMAQLMTDEMVPIGYVNSERWIRNGKKLATLCQLPYREEQSRNALFDEYLAGRSKRWGRLLRFGLCTALGLVFLLGGMAMLLGRTVNRRTRELAVSNLSLKQENEALARAERHLSLERDFASALVKVRTIEDCYACAVEFLIKIKEVACCGVMTINPDDGHLKMKLTWSSDARLESLSATYSMQTPFGRQVTHGEPFRLDAEAIAADLPELAREGLSALLVYPVRFMGEILAVLCLGSHEANGFPNSVQATLDPMADMLRNAALREKFAEISSDRELNIKNLVENNTYAIAIMNESEVLVYVNRLFEILSGYCCAEIIRNPISFSELFGEPQQERMVKHTFLESVKNELPSFFDLDIINKSGKTVPVECALRPILWHDKPCKYIVVRDISERIKSEQKLRDSEALFRTVAEGAFDGISLVDAAGVFLYVNEKLATTTQYTVAELVGAHYSEFMSPEDFRRIRLRLERRKGEERIYREFESRLTRRDGTNVPVSASTREIRLSGRQAFVIAYKDISVRKRMERELLQIAEWERIRIAQDLHDTVGQHISGMAYLMEVLSGKLKRDQSIHTDSSVELVEVARQTHHQLREVVKSLLPLAGGTKLAEALEHLCTNMRVLTKATFTLVDDGLGQVELETMMAEHLRCIAQEASANAVRHGKAKNIVITLTHENGMGALCIDDDGCGFDVDSERFSGSGLKIMNYRADVIEATLLIKRREGGGMSVLCTFILPHAADGINHHAKV